MKLPFAQGYCLLHQHSNWEVVGRVITISWVLSLNNMPLMIHFFRITFIMTADGSNSDILRQILHRISTKTSKHRAQPLSFRM